MFGRTLLVHGPESLLSDRHVAARVNAARAENPDAEVVRMSGAGMEGADFLEASGGSLFSAATVLVVSEISDIDKDLFPMVAGTAAAPGPDLCLVLVHPGGVKGKGLIDRLRKAGVERVDAAVPKPWEVPKFIAAEARATGLTLESGAADALQQALGDDLRTLASALAQVASDADSARISADMVTTYFGGRAEVKGYVVSDAILAGDVSGALEQLRWALSTGTAPVQVTSALALGLRRLGLYLDLRTARMNDYDLARAIGVPPSRVKELSRDSRGWSAQGVSRAISAVARADAAVKGASVDAEYALEAVLLQIDAVRRESARRESALSRRR
ncbi:MAG: DNA polymerase III subunit delta [Acidipropionibacterium sp.]|nr:DNA polymerase III subunit delta [Acidipropionibacterium sp.]